MILELAASVRVAERARRTAFYEAAEVAYAYLRDQGEDLDMAEAVYQLILAGVQKR